MGCVLVAIVVVAALVDVIASAGRVHPGVHVGDIAVGGMSRSEAAATIRQKAGTLISRPVTVRLDAKEWSLTSDQVGATVDATSLAQAAYSVGRDSGFFAAAAGRVGAWFGARDIPLVASTDAELLGVFLETVTEEAGTLAVDASVEVSGTQVTLVPPKEGTAVEESRAKEKIQAAFVSADRVVDVQLAPVEASITEDGAKAAYEAATALVSGPVTLTYDAKRWEVAPEQIAKWIAFRSSAATQSVAPGTATLVCYLDSAEVSATVVPLIKEVGKVARDATFKVSNGTVSIVPSQDGLGLDADALAVTLYETLSSPGQARTVELAMKRVEPAITTGDAKKMGIKERISTYTTDYAASNKPRVNNIHLLADALDGTLVPPGGVFSFNETIGPRTAEKGYQEANAIVNGELVPQLGGGVCQVGTTIFNTVFFSGLPVVERHNHSLYISHYPKGRDATVSWGGPDFKFKNDTKTWVLIATSYSSSTVTISLYGTDPGYDVEYKTGDFTNIVKYPVEEIKDPTLPKGTRVVEEKGVNGRTIVVTRIVKKGGTIIRTDTFKSVYKPEPEVVRVGTKTVSPSKPSTSSTPAP
ncbi:MAG: VanW family protein [Actinomycetia bacterium]|nr:VanW family protein [Actinomycetes bacterium]